MKLDTAIALLKNIRAQGKSVSDLIDAAQAEGRDGIDDAELDQVFAQYDTSHAAAQAEVDKAKGAGR